MAQVVKSTKIKAHSLSHFPDRVATGQCGFVINIKQKGESDNLTVDQNGQGPEAV